MFLVVTLLNKGLSLSLRFFSVLVLDLDQINIVLMIYIRLIILLSVVILFKTARFSIIILSENLSKPLIVIWEFWFLLDSNWLRGERTKIVRSIFC